VSKAKPKVKVVVERISGVRIETTRNGYKVTTGGTAQCAWGTLIFYDSGSGKNQAGARYDQPSGEYVFADFASLSAWLKKYLKHGGGVEA
jgi:hypothetical protein